MATYVSQLQGRHHRFRWSWFSGANERVLEIVESERDFLVALGMTVVALSIASGFILTVAASEWWTVPIRRVIWVGPAWTTLILLIERLVLKSFGTSWRWNVVISVPRALLTLAIAFVFGLPMTHFIFRPSIAEQLSTTQAAQVKEATNLATGFYSPKIAAAATKIQSIESAENALRQQHIHYVMLAGCEANEPACSTTHEFGCANVCQRYRHEASLAEQTLASRLPADRATIAKLRASMTTWQGLEQTEITARTQAIGGNTDMLARQEALQAIEKQHPSVTTYVRFVLLFFIALDLVPLMIKLTHLFSTGGAYEQAAAALRERDLVGAHRIRREAEVARESVDLQAHADIEVERARIDAEADRKIAEWEAKWSEWTGSIRRNTRNPLTARTLSQFAPAARRHESVPVPVPHRLRLAGLIGTGLVAALTLVLGFYSFKTGHTIAGEWIAIAALTADIGLAIYTRGFRVAPHWALWSTFATLITGLVLPLLLLVLNL